MSYTVLIVDDEVDIHTVTKMALKRMRFRGEKLNFVAVESGAAALEHMRDFPDTAVILMDVVMESEQAGLDAVKEIREALGNEMVRILLRTGQPGQTPEKEVIDTYDIDGYLSKAEVTTTRLYTSVRTALKSFSELQTLQLHRDALRYLNHSLLTLHDSDSFDEGLEKLVQIASELAPSPLTLLYLEIPEGETLTPHLYYHGPEECDAETLEQRSKAFLSRLQEQSEVLSEAPCAFDEGYLVPVQLRQGQGFIFVGDHTAQIEQTLPLLAGHAALAAALA